MLTSLISREVQTKTTMGYPPTPVRTAKSKWQETTSVGEDVEKREPWCTVAGDVNWGSHCGKTVWRFLEKLKRELPCDSAILLLGVCPKKTKTLI